MQIGRPKKRGVRKSTIFSPGAVLAFHGSIALMQKIHLFISCSFILSHSLCICIPLLFFFHLTHSLSLSHCPPNYQHSQHPLHLYPFTAMTDYNTDYSKRMQRHKGKKKCRTNKNLLSHGMNLLDAMLMAACKDDNLDILEKVLAADASEIDINHTDEAGNTALHYA